MSSPGPDLKRGRSAVWRGVAASLLLGLVAALVVAGLRHRRMAEAPLVAGQGEEKEDAEEPGSPADTVSEAAIIAELAQDQLRTPGEEERVLSEPQRELLERLQRELADPAKRLPALLQLWAYAGYNRPIIMGSAFFPEPSALEKRAGEIVAPYDGDPVIIKQLLDSNEAPQQRLGLWFWLSKAQQAVEHAHRRSDQAPPTPLPAEEKIWHAMTPRLRVLAERSPYCHMAIEALLLYRAENLEFLRGMIPRDKSAQKVFHLLDDTVELKQYEPSNRDQLFDVQLRRLLNDPDVETRKYALAFIYMNVYSAEMYWVDFSPAVAKRAEELEASSDAGERECAKGAVEALPELRTRLAELRERTRSRQLKAGWLPDKSPSGAEFLVPPGQGYRDASKVKDEPSGELPPAGRDALRNISITLPEVLGPLRPTQPIRGR